MTKTERSRAFAVKFEDLKVWSVGAFFDVKWQWPSEYIKPLSSALRQKFEEVNREEYAFEALQLMTLHFDGSIEPRDLHGQDEFKGKLYFAHTGDVIYSKIDVRNGAIGIISEDMPLVAVSSEYPVYKVLSDTAIPQYVQLLFRTNYFQQAINSMISGSSGRKRVQPSQLLEIRAPFPPRPIQEAIVLYWQKAQEEFNSANIAFRQTIDNLNTWLLDMCKDKEILRRRFLSVKWNDTSSWDTKAARASTFRISNPSFRPLGDFAEEATNLVKPWEKPEEEWPVYGVNNKEGVFLSHYQKGDHFNAAYKSIQKDWFFHNPTRAAVGSLGIVPGVQDNALTSPEYQVWRIKHGLLPGYVAVLINTPFFINLVRIHRVGAVKQRLYVENLLQIPVPVLSPEEQWKVSVAREAVLKQVELAREKLHMAQIEVEALILGTKTLSAFERIV